MSVVELDRPIGMPSDIARKIGFVAPGVDAVPDAQPQSQIDWALHWGAKGLHVFPCKRFLGTPLVARWYDHATTKRGDIIAWWSTWPDADIAAVPEKSGHFVIIAAGERGRKNLATLGDFSADFATDNLWGDRHLWIKGRAFSTWHVLPQVHVLGAARFVYLPNSAAPNPDGVPVEDDDTQIS